MKAEDLMNAAHITATKITDKCVKIETDKGWRLKSVATTKTTNENGEEETRENVSYTSCLYCNPDIELQGYEVVSDMSGMTLEEAKEKLLVKIAEYDESEAVNSFSVAGQSLWLDKATRVALMNSATVSKNMGLQSVTLWLGETPLQLPTDTAIALLSKVEMYAQECFNITATHKVAATALETVDECIAYNYTQGYPERLEFDLAALGLNS